MMITPVSLRTQKQENFQFKASLTHIANPVSKTKIGYRLQEIQESHLLEVNVACITLESHRENLQCCSQAFSSPEEATPREPF